MFQVFCHLFSHEGKIHLHNGKSKGCDTNSVDHVRNCGATTWDSSGRSDTERFTKIASTRSIVSIQKKSALISTSGIRKVY